MQSQMGETVQHRRCIQAPKYVTTIIIIIIIVRYRHRMW